MRSIVIAGARRTPIGTLGGSLSALSEHQLGAVAIRAALGDAGIDPGEIDETILGQVLTAGQGMNPTRQASREPDSAGLACRRSAQHIARPHGQPGLRVGALRRRTRRAADPDLRCRNGRLRRTGERVLRPPCRAPATWQEAGRCDLARHGDDRRVDRRLIGEKGGIAIAPGATIRNTRFFPEARLNYAENLLAEPDNRPAIIGRRPARRPLRPPATGAVLGEDLVRLIRTRIRGGASPRHVPARIVAVADIPRTRSGKMSEIAVREAIHGRPVTNEGAPRQSRLPRRLSQSGGAADLSAP